MFSRKKKDFYFSGKDAGGLKVSGAYRPSSPFSQHSFGKPRFGKYESHYWKKRFALYALYGAAGLFALWFLGISARGLVIFN